MTATRAAAVSCPPVATVGIIGGGQLARMTHQAAIALGVDLRTLTPRATDPAVLAGAAHHRGDHHDLEALLAFAEGCDVITLDHEHTPPALLRAVAEAGHRVRPRPDTAVFASDKSHARRALAAAGLPVPAFVEAERGDIGAVAAFARDHGWPVVLKAPTGGYDGRGVEIVTGPAALEASRLASASPRWLIEAAVPIAVELAVLVARRPSGWWTTYPVIETDQRGGICRELVLPARIPSGVAHRATSLAVSIADGIDAAGILAVELFLTPGGDLVVNEVATRPHNSGHATIDAAATSQFENHLRGVLDWPLGATDLLAPAAATVNVLAPAHPIDLRTTVPKAIEDPTVHVHLYRKEPRPGRKLGHVTCLASDPGTALTAARRAAATLIAP
ncbi:MAG: 5-(carboxyamino)imidazole ribonucleotide synthase [Actinomycetota bacterium]